MRGREDPRHVALALLGLPAEATREELAGAYRRAVMATHPDRCGDADAGERFAAVVAAYRQALADHPDPPPAVPRPTAVVPRRRGRPPSPVVPLVAGPPHFTPYRWQPSSRRRS